jgi:short-subunit dehydrogenase
MKKSNTEMFLVITGGTKGIGRAIADLFADKGYNIATCSRSLKDLESMALEYKRNFNVDLLYKKTDLNKVEEIKAFADYILGEWGKVDILINNAGYFTISPMMEDDPNNLQYLLNLNLFAHYHMCKYFAPYMIEQGSGHIFNVCSVAGIKPFPSSGFYSVSKYASIGFTKNLREELKDKGIKVTAVIPGSTMSDSWSGADINPSRLMRAADLAHLVFAASSLSSNTVVEEIVMRPQLGDI